MFINTVRILVIIFGLSAVLFSVVYLYNLTKARRQKIETKLPDLDLKDAGSDILMLKAQKDIEKNAILLQNDDNIDIISTSKEKVNEELDKILKEVGVSIKKEPVMPNIDSHPETLSGDSVPNSTKISTIEESTEVVAQSNDKE